MEAAIVIGTRSWLSKARKRLSTCSRVSLVVIPGPHCSLSSFSPSPNFVASRGDGPWHLDTAAAASANAGLLPGLVHTPPVAVTLNANRLTPAAARVTTVLPQSALLPTSPVHTTPLPQATAPSVSVPSTTVAIPQVSSPAQLSAPTITVETAALPATPAPAPPAVASPAAPSAVPLAAAPAPQPPPGPSGILRSVVPAGLTSAPIPTSSPPSGPATIAAHQEAVANAGVPITPTDHSAVTGMSQGLVNAGDMLVQDTGVQEHAGVGAALSVLGGVTLAPVKRRLNKGAGGAALKR